MSQFAVSLSLAALTLVSALVLALVPSVTGKGVPMGVRVPQEYSDHPVIIGAVKKYRLAVLILGVVASALTLVFGNSSLVTALLPLLAVTGSAGFYAVLRRPILEVKTREGWFAGIETSISGTIARTENDRLLADFAEPRFPWFSMLLSLLIILLPALYVAARWDSIPAEFATHFDGNLEPDAWSAKSVGSVFMGTFIGLLVWVSTAGAAALISLLRVNQRSDRSVAGTLRTAAVLAGTNKGLGFLTLVLSVGMALLQLSIPLTEFRHLNSWAFWLIMGGSTPGVLVMLALIFSYYRKANRLVGFLGAETQAAESPDNDNLYKWGIFYYNPDDPAVLVDKRFGVGVDFNYASWQAKAFLIFISLAVVLSLMLPLLLS